MATPFTTRYATTARWAEVDETLILELGEPGYDTDIKKYKVGDGASKWSELKFATGDLPGGELGSIPYQSEGGVTFLLAPNTSLTKKYLAMTGDGEAGAAPEWVEGSAMAGGFSSLNIWAGQSWLVQYLSSNRPDLYFVQGTGITFSTEGDGGINFFIGADIGTGATQVAAGNHTHTAADVGAIPLEVCEDTREPTGWIDDEDSDISWEVTNPSPWAAEFTVSPSATSFAFYSAGTKYVKTEAEAVAFTNVTGLHYFYYDATGVLTHSTDPWEIKSANVPVATLYWNATLQDGLPADERHGCQMDGLTQEYLHETRGAAFAWGMALTSATNGTTTTIAAGEFYDDDKEVVFSQQTTVRCVWRDGSGNATWAAVAAGHFVNSSGGVGTGTPAYDASGTLTVLGLNKYANIWLFATNLIDSPIVAIIGQASYNTQALAEAATPASIVLGFFPAAELLPIYQITYQNSGGAFLKKSVKDYRRIQGGTATNFVATDHRALINLTWTASGHTGTASGIAGFDADGLATTYTIGTASGNIAAGDHGHALEDLGAGATGASLFAAATTDAADAILKRGKARMVVVENDFFGTGIAQASPIIYGALSSGTIAVGTANANHPGVVVLKDSTTNNGGYRAYTEPTGILIAGGEKFTVVFQINSNRSTQTCRLGFHNSTDYNAPTNGVWIDLVGDGSTGAVATGKATNAGGTTSTGTTYTCLTDTWYSATVVLNADATLATFTIYNEAGASVWTNTVNANIPTSAGRFVGITLIATQSSNDAAANMISLDYVRAEILRDLTR